MPIEGVEQAVEDSLSCTTTVAALLFLAEKFPHRQFNSAELSIISGIGRTADVADRTENPRATRFRISVEEISICRARQVHYAATRFLALQASGLETKVNPAAG